MENGTYLVGTDIEPGRYRSPGVDGSLCYYDQTNDKGDILDQGVAPSGPSIADLKAGRKFKSSGCQPWTKIG